jgi:hypothetical protein
MSTRMTAIDVLSPSSIIEEKDAHMPTNTPASATPPPPSDALFL